MTTCTSGSAALELLRENAHDLVLSDVYMPDMSGFRLLEIIGLEMDVPVISACPVSASATRHAAGARGCTGPSAGNIVGPQMKARNPAQRATLTPRPAPRPRSDECQRRDERRAARNHARSG